MIRMKKSAIAGFSILNSKNNRNVNMIKNEAFRKINEDNNTAGNYACGVSI